MTSILSNTPSKCGSYKRIKIHSVSLHCTRVKTLHCTRVKNRFAHAVNAGYMQYNVCKKTCCKCGLHTVQCLGKGSLINYSGQDKPVQPLRAIQDLSCISMDLSTADSEGAASMKVHQVLTDGKTKSFPSLDARTPAFRVCDLVQLNPAALYV